MVTGLWPRAVTVIDMNAPLKAMARDGSVSPDQVSLTAPPLAQPATKADRQMPEAALGKKKRQGMGNDVEILEGQWRTRDERESSRPRSSATT